MSEKTTIEWTDATFNPWWGCTRVSPACAHCYADAMAKRFGMPDLWENDGVRRFLSDENWRKPLRWNDEASVAGVPVKVFCASMADVFEDHPELEAWRERLWSLIEETPWLIWQLLTKRPENVAAMAPWSEWPSNIWLGASIENSRFTFRADLLREIPAKTRFLSVEPILASVFLNTKPNRKPLDLDGIDWVIVGGESGPRARPPDLDWFRELREACAATCVAFFLKQLGGVADKRGGAKAVLDGERHTAFPPYLTPASEAWDVARRRSLESRASLALHRVRLGAGPDKPTAVVDYACTKLAE